MKEKIMRVFMTAVFLAGMMLVARMGSAAEPIEGGGIGEGMKRGGINLVTFPGELVRTAMAEKEVHPRAWPLAYVPKTVFNVIARASSSVNDLFIMPTHAWATKDTRPITSFFSMPDYVWERSE